MSTNEELYAGETHRFPTDMDDDSRALGSAADYLDDIDDDLDEGPGTVWHPGLDIGLLVLRVAVGGTMVLNALHKFGMFGGTGMDAWPEILASQGFTAQTDLLAWLHALSELVGGGLLIVGLFTPLAAAAVLGVMTCATYLIYDVQGMGYFPQLLESGGQVPGYAHPLLVGAGALALLFTGPGRVCLDVAFPWRKRPLPYGLLGLVLAAAAAVAVLALFR